MLYILPSSVQVGGGGCGQDEGGQKLRGGSTVVAAPQCIAGAHDPTRGLPHAAVVHTFGASVPASRAFEDTNRNQRTDDVALDTDQASLTLILPAQTDLGEHRAQDATTDPTQAAQDFESVGDQLDATRILMY